MRGFELFYAKRPIAVMARITVEDQSNAQQADGRIAPVSRLAKRFLDAIESELRQSGSFWKDIACSS
jgi:hypothetical protein